MNREEIKQIIDESLAQNNIENNKVILEAVDFAIDKRMQENTVRQEEFEDRIIKTIKDVMTSDNQTGELSDRVENSEKIIKTNILPRLDLLEAK